MNYPDLAIRLNDFVRRNKAIIIYSFVIAIICYGYELFNFSFSIDEELDSFVSAIDLKRRILRGRWGIYFIQIFLFPHSVIPYLPTLISVLAIAVTSVLFVNNEGGDLRSKIVFSTIFISFPIHSYYIEFNIFNYLVGIGMVLTVISFLLAKHSFEGDLINIKLFLLSIPLLSLSFSIYQGILPIFIILVLFHTLLIIIDEAKPDFKRLIKKVIGFSLVFCFSFILFKLIEIGLKYLFFNSFEENDVYLESFNKWGSVPSFQILLNVIKSTLYYLWGEGFYGGFSLKSIIVLVPIILFSIIKKVKGTFNILLSISLLGLIILCPFTIMFLLGSYLPPRSLLALPFLLAFLWWFTYRLLNPLLKEILIASVFILFFANSYHTTRLFYSSYVNWQADTDMANRIIERIYTLELPAGDQIPVVFIGKYQHPPNELFMKTNDVFGTSFFYWDNGKPDRMNALFKSIGITNFKILYPENQMGIAEKVDKLPCWPRKGSVTVLDSVIFVKLSEYNLK